ncbi:hypothetical protein EXIGLDRAFT_20628 [Exidia glandulosa HHB12029]|uniref:BTB domain-containing protein n=1 Tax=Exidia glandulosa HHB12029 TaxID=1314781 RepID=A0A165QY78_EXIGL|nr:hypothetical protein EXIGLDRAFT_20628 [Exidia glandulosa HHB12029]
MSKIPTQVIDRSQVLVTIETASLSLKTTYDTLTSRPSHLSTFLRNTIQTPDDGEVVQEGLSSASTDATSPFRSLFQDHLVAAGVLPETTHSVHIFLDRPSEPYPYILAYLRAPGSHLPHGVKLSQKLEDLVALRDEARFLDLLDLARMCTDELSRHRMVRVGTGVAHVAPLERIYERRSPTPPDPILTHVTAPSPARISHPENPPVSAVARPGYI